jgi:hypothetical protein
MEATATATASVGRRRDAMEIIHVECECGFSTGKVLHGYIPGASSYEYLVAYFPESGELVSRGLEPRFSMPPVEILRNRRELIEWFSRNNAYLQEFGPGAVPIHLRLKDLYCPRCKRHQAMVVEDSEQTPGPAAQTSPD